MNVTWQEELRLQSEKYHRIGAWVAIIFNPLFAIQDWFEFPQHFNDFLIWRVAVVTLSLLAFLVYRPLKLGPEWLIFIPFLGIAVQNAYMYSVMPEDVIQKHTFAYIALFIGAGMLILWKPVYSILVVVLNLIANVIFYSLYSSLKIEELLINGGLLTFTVSCFTVILIHTRYNLTKKEIKARLALEDSKNEIEKQKEIIEHAHEEVQASITYAERIQSALLSGDESWERIGTDRFILFRPRDVVSGDFYWAYANEDLAIWAAADCTGHGVPGAFMSMLGIGFLNEIVAEGGETDPSGILNQLRAKIIKSLDQRGEGKRKDGMDISMCTWHFKTNRLVFSGAYNPLVLVTENAEKALKPLQSIEDGDKRYKKLKVDENDPQYPKGVQLIEFKSDRMPVGVHVKSGDSFTNTEIQLHKGDILYSFSDGFQDQFGGEKGAKYMIKRMKKKFLTLYHVPMDEQKDMLNDEFDFWMQQGDAKQIDDVCLVGIKI